MIVLYCYIKHKDESRLINKRYYITFFIKCLFSIYLNLINSFFTEIE